LPAGIHVYLEIAGRHPRPQRKQKRRLISGAGQPNHNPNGHRERGDHGAYTNNTNSALRARLKEAQPPIRQEASER
jgi:hypothetical protein